MSGLMDGKVGLVVGVANKRSIAWATTRALDAAGATVALTYQNERLEGAVRRLGESLDNAPAAYLPLDVTDDAQVEGAVDGAAQALGGLDFLVHAVAFARPEDLEGRYVGTSREGWNMALDISAYSLSALAERAEPHMAARGGGAIVAMSYLAAERAVPGYNIMGIAKSALESSVRLLAWDLGEHGIRVNAVSAGPVRTLAAKGVQGFSDMVDLAAQRSPLRRAITVDEVGDATMFLLSPLSSAITGEVLHVDAGYHAMGM
jgi:enoyl-[acyl-carrier protein] reductase I